MLAGVRLYSTGVVDALIVELCIIAILGTLLPFLILALARREAEHLNFKAKKVESADYFLLVFLGSYAAPVIMQMAKIDFFTMTVVVILFFLVAWFISNIPSHPLLYIFRYRFYKVESEDGMVFMLITKRTIRRPSNISRVVKISNGMLME
ncbi:hypothetical protein D3C84_903240 [compost metagenome]